MLLSPTEGLANSGRRSIKILRKTEKGVVRPRTRLINLLSSRELMEIINRARGGGGRFSLSHSYSNAKKTLQHFSSQKK